MQDGDESCNVDQRFCVPPENWDDDADPYETALVRTDFQHADTTAVFLF
jgi:hypothetical protein